jgi:hypothetical protein
VYPKVKIVIVNSHGPGSEPSGSSISGIFQRNGDLPLGRRIDISGGRDDSQFSWNDERTLNIDQRLVADEKNKKSERGIDKDGPESTPCSEYIRVGVMSVFSLFSIVLGKLGLEIISPIGDACFFGGIFILAAVIAYFMFCI